MTQATATNVAIICSGVLRSGLPSGALNYGHILALHPWGLKYGVYRFTGAEFRDYLKKVASMSPGDGAFPQMAGLRLRLDTTSGELTSIEVSNGAAYAPLDLEATYDVALTDFNARGGDGYPDVRRHFVETRGSVVDAEALKAFIRAKSPIDPATFATTGYFSRD